jgi:hypothetical protein
MTSSRRGSVLLIAVGQNTAVAYWKLLFVAMKMRRGWNRIPPDQRRKLIAGAGKQVRKHGPTVAKRVGAAVQAARKRR